MLATRSRGTSVALAPPSLETGLRFRYAFLGKDEDGAKSIVSELDDYRKEWRAYIENNRDDLAKAYLDKINEHPDVARNYEETMFDLLLEGIERARAGRSGLVATLDIEPEPSASEQKMIARYLAAQKRNAETAARIVRTLASGRNADPGDLEQLGGKKLTERIAQAKAGGTSATSGTICATAKACCKSIATSAGSPSGACDALDDAPLASCTQALEAYRKAAAKLGADCP